ncbi:MAG: SufD family Fe-S cluster assembly protein, partial [Gammaproteobacteria bacterium]
MGAFDRELAAALHAPAPGSEWLAVPLAAARERWLGAPWPTRKTEAWKYTSLEALEAEAWLRVPAPAVQPLAAPRIPGLDADYLVFRNGRFDAAASAFEAAPGITLTPFSAAGGEEREFLAQHLGAVEAEAPSLFADLAGCWSAEGLLLRIARGARAPRPVCVVHLSDPAEAPCAWGQRLFLQAGPGSESTLIEYFPASGAAFVAGLTEISLAAGARLAHLRLQLDAPDSVHLGSVHASLGASACYESLVFATGSRLKRLDLRHVHQGPGAELRADGVYLARASQLVDIHSAVDHASPQGRTA